jgi:small subunit ribosomal protein S16
MPVKIRLQRHGKKGKPFYWVVAADARAKRDGKYLEKLGTYNPNTNPATIEINVDNAVTWLNNGAQPTETAKRILSYKGVLLKHHLLGGLRKGALTEEQVAEKFNAWLEDKGKIVGSKVGDLDKAKADARATALKAEKEVNAKRIADAVPVVEEVVEVAAPEAVVETPEAPQPEIENADTTPIPTLVEKEVLAETEGIAEAPSVEEVVADQKEEDTDKKA